MDRNLTADNKHSHYFISQHVLTYKCLCIYRSRNVSSIKGKGSLLPPRVFGKIGFFFVLHRHLCVLPLYVFTRCFALVLMEKGWLIGEDRWLFKFELEPIPIPPLVFPAQGQRRKEGKGCHSVSHRYKSKWQTSKTPELSSTDLRPCSVLALLFHDFYSGVIVTYCWCVGLFVPFVHDKITYDLILCLASKAKKTEQREEIDMCHLLLSRQCCSLQK